MKCGDYRFFYDDKIDQAWLPELTGKKSKALPYELTGADPKPSKAKNCEFSVHVKGKPVIEQISLAKEYGSFRAVKIKAFAATAAGESLIIDFVPTKEDAVLRGIELKRNGNKNPAVRKHSKEILCAYFSRGWKRFPMFGNRKLQCTLVIQQYECRVGCSFIRLMEILTAQ